MNDADRGERGGGDASECHADRGCPGACKPPPAELQDLAKIRLTGSYDQSPWPVCWWSRTTRHLRAAGARAGREGYEVDLGTTGGPRSTRVRPRRRTCSCWTSGCRGWTASRSAAACARRDRSVPILMLTARDGELDEVPGSTPAPTITSRSRSGSPSARPRPRPAAPRRARRARRRRRRRRATERARRAWRGDRELELSPKEFDLLAALVATRAGAHARAAHGRGLGRELVRLDQDARRAHFVAARQARRPAADHHRARRRLPLRAG